jgi:hypothetical protein
MKSEIIFREVSSCRGRYGDMNETTLTIGASFDNPAEWPYTLKQVRTNQRRWDSPKEITYEESYKLSKDVYTKIRGIIADAKYDLQSCDEALENDTMDGCVEAFTFSVDGFEKLIHGDEILSSGSYEAERCTPDKQTENYVVFTVVEKMKTLLSSVGIEIYF